MSNCRFWFFVKFFFKRLLAFLVSLWLVISITFVLLHTLPGDPFAEDLSVNEETKKALQKYYGIDQPLRKQYQSYLVNVLHLNLGRSIKYPGRSVQEIIATTFPVSFWLGVQALIVAVFGGVLLAVIISLLALSRRNSFWLKSSNYLSLLLLSLPAFLVATLLQYIFAIKLQLLPLARWGSFSHTILPTISLAYFPFAYILKLCRVNIVQRWRQKFVETARAKGLSETKVLVKHILPGALTAVFSYLGPLIASVFTGSFVVEKIFGIAGLGSWLISSISNRDYPVIMGIAIFYASILMLSNLIISIICYGLNMKLISED